MVKVNKENTMTGKFNKKRKKSAVSVDYATAEPEMKEIMDGLIADILEDPENDDLILDYGSEPMQSLEGKSEDIIEVQKKWTAATSSLQSKFDRFEAMKDSFDMDSMKDRISDGAKDLGKKSAKGFGKALALIGSAANIFSRKEKKEEHDLVLEELNDRLPELFAEMNEIIDDLDNSLETIEQVKKLTDEMAVAWIQTIDDLALYVGAGKELQRVFKEEIIPYAQEQDDDIYLDVINSNSETLNMQVVHLEQTMMMGMMSVNQLRTLQKSIKDQYQKTRFYQKNGTSQWKAAIAQTGLASTVLKAAKQLERAGEFGTDVVSLGVDATEQTQDIMNKQLNTGVMDTEKLLENGQRVIKQLEKGASETRERNKLLEAQSSAINETMQNMSQAAQEYKNAHRQLEDGSKKKKKKGPSAALKDAQNETTSSNDNKGVSKIDQIRAEKAAQEKETPKKKSAGTPKKPGK